MIMPIPLKPQEKKNGYIYLVLSLFVLPVLIQLLGATLSMDAAQINFVYYAVNFTAVMCLFGRFLFGNLLVALDRVFPVIWFAVLSYLGYDTVGELVNMLIYSISPSFANLNDAAVTTMVLTNPLFAFAVIALVPVAEETLYRGLIFRGLYDRAPVAAYLVSMAVFSAIHVSGYIGTLSPLHLALSFLQYLPAGYCLCFAYRRSGTILCPIFVHMAINAVSVLALMR